MCKDCGCGSTGNVTTKLFYVPGMMCMNCENTVNGAVRGLPGVLESTVDLKTKEVRIRFDHTKIEEAAIRAAIDETGFEVESVKDYVHEHGGILGAIKKIFK